MSWLIWTVIIMAAILVVEFIVICPDKLPWRRKKK